MSRWLRRLRLAVGPERVAVWLAVLVVVGGMVWLAV